MRTEVFLGIDPGKDGAIAVLGADGTLKFQVTPTVAVEKGRSRRTFDTSGMVAALRTIHVQHAIRLAVLERVSAMPQDGPVQAFSFGEGYGIWRGILAALGIPHVLVPPKTWKAKVLAGTKQDKGAAIEWCQARFPNVSLLRTPRCSSPHDGFADAACMAEYGRRQVVGDNQPKLRKSSERP